MTILAAFAALIFALVLPFLVGYAKDRWFAIRDMTADQYEHDLNPAAYHRRHGRH